MKKLSIPPLADGETYIGAIGDTAGNLHHVILLPGDNDDDNWQAQMNWAKEQGGDLPSKTELAMIWSVARDQFQKDWYWSNQAHESDSGYAWFQGFLNGRQISLHKGHELRARAVRRLPI